VAISFTSFWAGPQSTALFKRLGQPPGGPGRTNFTGRKISIVPQPVGGRSRLSQGRKTHHCEKRAAGGEKGARALAAKGASPQLFGCGSTAIGACETPNPGQMGVAPDSRLTRDAKAVQLWYTAFTNPNGDQTPRPRLNALHSRLARGRASGLSVAGESEPRYCETQPIAINCISKVGLRAGKRKGWPQGRWAEAQEIWASSRRILRVLRPYRFSVGIGPPREARMWGTRATKELPLDGEFAVGGAEAKTMRDYGGKRSTSPPIYA